LVFGELRPSARGHARDELTSARQRAGLPIDQGANDAGRT
jgi:hypothetical protein